MKKSRVCKLCSGVASLYCESDSAFLCFDCDARVHQANFLVGKHMRQTICCTCEDFDGKVVSGVGFRPFQSICQNCEADGDSVSEMSSSSLDSAESSVVALETGRKKTGGDRKRSVKIARSDSVSDRFADQTMREDVEGILENWSRKVGLRSGCCVALALHAYGVCSRKLTKLPLGLSLASSLWLAANLCEPRGVSTCQLTKLQQCSRAPAKLIVSVESKLSRMLTKSSREEGWAECPDS